MIHRLIYTINPKDEQAFDCRWEDWIINQVRMMTQFDPIAGSTRIDGEIATIDRTPMGPNMTLRAGQRISVDINLPGNGAISRSLGDFAVYKVFELPDDYDPDFPYLLIIDGSEPLPDPSWDYAQIYYRSVSIRREVEALLSTLEVDDGTPETDQAIRDRLRQMSAQINAAMGELD